MSGKTKKLAPAHTVSIVSEHGACSKPFKGGKGGEGRGGGGREVKEHLCNGKLLQIKFIDVDVEQIIHWFVYKASLLQEIQLQIK